MTLFLKKWLASVNETGATSITNFTLLWLVIFYLQTKRILPAIIKFLDTDTTEKVAGNKLKHTITKS